MSSTNNKIIQRQTAEQTAMRFGSVKDFAQIGLQALE